MTHHMTRAKREALIADESRRALEHDDAAELSLLAAILAEPATWAEPSAGLEDAVVDEIVRGERRASTVTAVDDLATARRRRARRHPRLMVPVAAAVATVAVVLGSMFAASGGAGASFTAQLAPTGLAPGAHASAAVTPNRGGFRITLDAAGLRPLPAGAYYEAWLKDSTGTLVPVGTFSSSDDHVTLWSGVSPSTFTTLTVTIERPDNDQASSGQVVLRGDVRPQ